ncbi:MAG: restriction endonuclease subunit S [Clostridiaceae bacterium]|nr:restriction endonuclease subunit S [Clostridiaceae bacterium]
MVKYKRYDRYKESGVEWIGEIPEQWKVNRLKYIANSITYKVAQHNVELKYLGLEHIEKETGNIIEGYDNLDVEAEGEALRYFSGNVLFGKLRPYLKKCIVANSDGKCTSELLVLETKNGEYLKYIMLDDRFINEVNSSTYGAKMPRANWEHIRNIKIMSPSLKEQIQIAYFLNNITSKIDALITDKEKLITLLEEKRQAIITEAVTKGLNDSVKMKDSGVEWIGDIPEHWELSKIKYTSYVKGRIGWQGLRSDEFTDEGPYLVTGTDFKDGIVTWESCYHISEERYNEAPAIQLKENDLLITKDGTIGKVAIVKNKPEKAILNSGIFVTRCLNQEYTTEFMYYMLASEMFKTYIKHMETGSTIKHLYQDTFVNFIYPLPKIDEQSEIIEYLNYKVKEIDSSINLINEQIQKLKEYRQSLISEAVTGKIDVRDIN